MMIHWVKEHNVFYFTTRKINNGIEEWGEMIMTAFNGLCSWHLREMWKSIRNTEGCQRSEPESIEKDEIEFFVSLENIWLHMKQMITVLRTANCEGSVRLRVFFSFARLVGCHDTVIQF